MLASNINANKVYKNQTKNHNSDVSKIIYYNCNKKIYYENIYTKLKNKYWSC